MNLKSITIGALSAFALSACVSTSGPVEISEPVVQAPEPVKQEPVAAAPAPAPAPVAAAPAVNLPTPGSVEDFAYRSGGESRVFFGYNRFDLSTEARDNLRAQSEWLNQYGNYTAIIEGHADERGTREYNLALAARRADSVKGFLVSQGVDPARLKTVSYGKERPIDGRSSEDGWARNRNGFTNLQAGGAS